MSDIERLHMPLRLEALQPDEKNASPPATSQQDEKKASASGNNNNNNNNNTCPDASPPPKKQLALQNECLVQQPSLQQNSTTQLTSVHSGSQGMGLSVPRHSFSNGNHARQQNDTDRGGGHSLGVAQDEGQVLVGGGGHSNQQGNNNYQVAQGQDLLGGRSSGRLQFQQPFPHQQANVQQGGDGQVRQPSVGSFQPGNNGLAAIAAGQNQGIDGSTAIAHQPEGQDYFLINQQGNHGLAGISGSMAVAHQQGQGSLFNPQGNNNLQQPWAPFYNNQVQGGVPPQQGYGGGPFGCMGPSGFNPYGYLHPGLQYGGAVSNHQVSCADSESSGIPPVVHADALRRGGAQLVHGHSLRTGVLQEDVDAADDDDITGVDDIDMQRMQIRLASQITEVEGNLTRLAEENLNQGRHREDNAAARHQEAEEHANERDRGLRDRMQSPMHVIEN